MSGAGLISGTPTVPGTYTFSTNVTDSGSPAQSKSLTASIVIAPSALTIASPTLAAGSYGVAYSQSLQASGGTAPYTWALSSGTLPAGIFLVPSNGNITGTPTASGTFTFAATVTDSGSPAQSKSVSASIVIAPSTLTIATGSVASGVTGSSYSQTLQASGGTPNYTWSIASGTLPGGLTLASSGLISGTLTLSGTFNVTFAVTDSGSPAQSKSAAYVFNVSPSSQLTITSSALASGTKNSAYSQSLQAAGGTPPYNWSISGGILPAGIVLTPSTGLLSGTPTAPGTSSFTATVADSSSPAQNKSIAASIVIAPVPLAISSASLASGTQGAAYSQSLQATGGTPVYTWSVTSGALPAGVTLSPSGVLSGTPTAFGTFPFAVTVADAGSPAQTRSLSTSIVIAPTALAITTTSLAAGTKSTYYSQNLQVTGGTPAYAWSITAGGLPAGLGLTSSGLLSGAPSVSGNFTFTATVTDNSSPAMTRSVSLSLTVAPSTLTFTSSPLPAATNGTAYSQSLQANGGTTPYTWSITSGSLPAGVTLNPSTGVLSGTPTASGGFTFAATVTDSGSPVQTKSVSLTLTVAPTALSITTSSLSAGTGGTAYSQTLQATGGTTGYTWSITAGSLPIGLTLTPSTGVIAGTPTASGTSNFTVMVTDSSSPALTKTAALSIAVSAAPLTITNSTLGSGTSGTAYTQLLTATGGTPAYTWNYSGNLPAGLTLAATTGVISGTPTTTGTFSFTVTVTDSSTPALTRSAATFITIAASTTPTGPGTTWYVRPDGGTRYSANATSGQCDGKSDTPYGGVGTNQHCAFKDYRYLWDDQSYNNNAWVISGGDTVILRGGPWRVGYDSNVGPGAGYTWCLGANNIGCVNPAIPAGTPTQHTRILGENYAACSATNKTQIFGGFGVITALNLSGAQYVDVQCLEITRHSQCIAFGSPAVPSTCNSALGSTLDDYDSDGVHTDVSTHDLLMQDLWIHGHVGRGVKGPIGGVVTCLRCDIAFNGATGWDFDDGTGSNNGLGTALPAGATWNFLYSTIEWSGCNQEYPAVHTIPVISCYGQSTGGQGDGVGTPAGTGLNVNIDHSGFLYNTQDGLDVGHVDTGVFTLNITNSIAYGNSGGTFKWGASFTAATFINNVAIANCLRLSAPMPGTPSNYNANLSDFCRAQDALPFNFRQGGTALLANNTVVSYAPTTFDINCWDASCSNSTLTFQNNLVLGYDNPATYNMGGQVGGPGGFYYQTPIGNVVRSNNVFYGLRNTTCPTGNPAEYCSNPLFVNQPVFTGESSLDNFNFNLTSGSPAKGAGLSLPQVTLDYNGLVRGNPPSIGAVE